MSFLEIFKRKATTWTYGMVSQEKANGIDTSSREIISGEDYIKIILKSMRIVYKGRGFGKYYPVVHSFASLGYLSGTKAEISYVTTPPKLAELDVENLDKVIQMNKDMLGPIPYRGGGLDLEIGLFSIKSVDLAKPIIDLVQNVADKSGIRFISAVMPYTEIIEQGLKLLTGSKDTILEIGLSTTYNPTATGYYAVIGAPKGTIDINDIQIDAKEFTLTTKDGKLVGNYPYLVFQIAASKQRDDWYEIPDVSAAYNKLQKDIREQSREQAETSFKIFKRTVLTSPDLIDADAETLVETINNKLKAKLDAMTICVNTTEELEDLKSIQLYSHEGSI